MKKLVAIFLVLMLFMASASAAEWGAGLGPNRPYENLPEVDFDETFGYILFHPNAIDGAPAGGKVLRIYVPREDVEIGSGMLTLRSDDGEEEWSVAFDNAEYVTRRSLLESELEDLLWGGGLCFEIMLPVSLRLGHTYYVDVDEGYIVDKARNKPSKAVTGKDSWHFETTDDYGVSKVEYLTPVDDGYETNMSANVHAGDMVRYDLLIGGEAKSALVYSYVTADNEAMIRFDSYVTADMEEPGLFASPLFTESCEIMGSVLVDDPAWCVYFFDVEVPPMDEAEFYEHLLAEVEF